MKTRGQVTQSTPAGAGVGLTAKVKFQRLERGEGVSHVAIQGKNVPGRGHSKCKGPEAWDVKGIARRPCWLAVCNREKREG